MLYLLNFYNKLSSDSSVVEPLCVLCPASRRTFDFSFDEPKVHIPVSYPALPFCLIASVMKFELGRARSQG